MNERQAQDCACRRLYAVSCCRRNFFLRRTQKIVYPPMTSMPTAVSCNEERKWIVCRAYHIRKDHARESAGEDSEILGIRQSSRNGTFFRAAAYNRAWKQVFRNCTAKRSLTSPTVSASAGYATLFLPIRRGECRGSSRRAERGSGGAKRNCLSSFAASKRSGSTWCSSKCALHPSPKNEGNGGAVPASVRRPRNALRTIAATTGSMSKGKNYACFIVVCLTYYYDHALKNI